jgi:ABC-type transport system involved in multi-copper enzyme maturation permease subunit
MKALALKELRELRGIIAFALVAYLILVARMIGVKAFDFLPGLPQDMESVPFLSGEFLSYFMVLAALFAMALGFRQSAWESSQGTYLFLLHKPVARQAIFATKLAVGVLVFLGCSAIPIALYGWWAATPGQHSSPFHWGWTVTAWWIAVLSSLLYLGAFLSGLRPARWFGTRLLPLAAAILLLVFLSQLSWNLWMQVPAILFTAMAFLCVIRFVARVRDYA